MEDWIGRVLIIALALPLLLPLEIDVVEKEDIGRSINLDILGVTGVVGDDDDEDVNEDAAVVVGQ